MHQPGVFFWRVVLGGFWLGHTISRKTFFFAVRRSWLRQRECCRPRKLRSHFCIIFPPSVHECMPYIMGYIHLYECVLRGVWVLYIYFGHYMQFCGTTYALFVVRFCFCARMRHTSCVRKVLPLLLFGFCFLFFPFSVREFVLLMQYL